MSNSITEKFRRELAERKAARIEPEPTPQTFAGMACRARPLSLEFYIRSGRMPNAVARILLAAGTTEYDREIEAASTDTVLDVRKFQREAVCRVLAEPRVVDVLAGEAPEGCLSYVELAEGSPEFVDECFGWILSGCPESPNGGEAEGLNANDLVKFPDGKGRRQRIRTRPAGKQDGAAPVVASAPDSK